MVAPDRKGLRDLTNIRLAVSGEAALPEPLPVGFVNPDAPLRVEIETLLSQVAKDKTGDKDRRNRNREALVLEYLEKNYPGNATLQHAVVSDLLSYQGYENA